MHQLWASRTDGEYFHLYLLISDGSLHNRQNSGSWKHLTDPDHDRFIYIAVKFPDWWNSPNAIGYIDARLIRIKCPIKDGSLFYNFKQFYSKVLQRVAVSESRSIFIDVGAYGKQIDVGIFSYSTL
jgi:hypothetical protein